jgi:hypothetical protein
MINAPAKAGDEYTRIKKDIFHAFQMIPLPINHGHRSGFLSSLRDHLMRWDPATRAVVDKTCKKVYNINFDEMLLRNPRYIQARTPRYVPAPSILVPAIEHVFNMYGNALDAKTNTPLFSKQAWKKANAVLELARQGYLSDLEGVVLYERAGMDKHGLQLWKCLRGTNKVEGGPHGDIYRKFGALNGKSHCHNMPFCNIFTFFTAGPRLTMNCLTDHRTWYNLQVCIFIICFAYPLIVYIL